MHVKAVRATKQCAIVTTPLVAILPKFSGFNAAFGNHSEVEATSRIDIPQKPTLCEAAHQNRPPE